MLSADHRGVLTVQSLQVMCPYPNLGVGALSDREAKDREAKAKREGERERVWERAGKRIKKKKK